MMDELEERTRPIMLKARENLVKEKGTEDVLKPWNTGYMMAGDVTKKYDSFAFFFVLVLLKAAR